MLQSIVNIENLSDESLRPLNDTSFSVFYYFCILSSSGHVRVEICHKESIKKKNNFLNFEKLLLNLLSIFSVLSLIFF